MGHGAEHHGRGMVGHGAEHHVRNKGTIKPKSR